MSRTTGNWDWRNLFRKPGPPPVVVLPVPPAPVRIGLALGGGFARGMAHIGILRAFEKNHIPLHCITGVSAGAIVAAAYASGTSTEEISRMGCGMRFADIARWSICKLGLVASERMSGFLKRLLTVHRFEDMKIPLGVVATDLGNGQPVLFREQGDVMLPIRASCSYPGLFQPVRLENRMLVDGAISMEVPALLARMMGATHVISACIPMQHDAVEPHNMFEVVNRSFQIMMSRTEGSWRKYSDKVIMPDVSSMSWDGFGSGQKIIAAGEAAATAALPAIRAWLRDVEVPEAVEALAS